MRARSSIFLLGTAALLAGCGLCDRDTEADGVYQITTDCTGTLAHGTIQIGGSGDSTGGVVLQPSSCLPAPAADAGVHGAAEASSYDASASSADAGVTAAPVLCQVPTSNAVEQTNSCPETTAYNARTLGLPSQVRVEGKRTFELHGEVGGRYLDCTPERFGDERILMCRSLGRMACVAVLENLQ